MNGLVGVNSRIAVHTSVCHVFLEESEFEVDTTGFQVPHFLQNIITHSCYHGVE